MPSSSGEAASSTEVAAPCSIVFHTISGLVASNEAGAFAVVSSPMKRIF